jgi:hypothetical protein
VPRVGIIDGTLLTVRLTPFSTHTTGNTLTRKQDKEVIKTLYSLMEVLVLTLCLALLMYKREHLESNSTKTLVNLKKIWLT